MTAGIRAGEMLWRNFWHGGSAAAPRHNASGRTVPARAFQHDQFGQAGRGQTPDILTGSPQRIDILTGRPIN